MHDGNDLFHTRSHRCIERNGRPAKYAKGKIILTVAHLDHNEQNCDDDNLKAMCQRCHLRYDRSQHARNASATRRAISAALQVPERGKIIE